MRSRFFFRRGGWFALLCLISAVPALADPSAATPGPSAPTKADETAKPDAAPEAVVTGFRSAHFDMDEAEVRAAIAQDFGKTTTIKATTNAAERTHGLTITVPDVLPGGGAADIAYIFGYKSKKLIQISIVWSKTTDPTMTPEKLVGDAQILRQTFTEQNYKADTIVSDVAIKNGVIMFRGSGSDGHTTALILQGRTDASKSDKTSFVPLSLLLLYIADPKHADVFRLKPGQF